MKKIVLVTVLLLISIKAFSQWEFAGLSNVRVATFTSNGTDLYAGTGFGIYKALNNGTNWIPSGMNANSISSIALAPGKIYAVLSVLDGVYMSTNNGITFANINPVTNPSNVVATRNNYVYVGFLETNPGLYYTTNNGSNWIYTSLRNEYIQSLLISNNYMYCGTISHGVYYSTDYGENWTQSNLNNRTVRSIALKGNYAYAGTEIGGVYISSDNGINWNQTNMNNKSIFAVASEGNYLFAGTFGEGIFLSTNNGDTWIQKNQGLGNLYANGFIVHNNYVYAGTNDGIWRRSLQEIISINPISSKIPKEYKLYQNYPNPFNPTTTIKSAVPRASSIKISVFDVSGREVETLVNEQLQPGTYSTQWNASAYSSGVYFYKIQSGEFSETKRMLLLK